MLVLRWLADCAAARGYCKLITDLGRAAQQPHSPPAASTSAATAQPLPSPCHRALCALLAVARRRELANFDAAADVCDRVIAVLTAGVNAERAGRARETALRLRILHVLSLVGRTAADRLVAALNEHFAADAAACGACQLPQAVGSPSPPPQSAGLAADFYAPVRTYILRVLAGDARARRFAHKFEMFPGEFEPFLNETLGMVEALVAGVCGDLMGTEVQMIAAGETLERVAPLPEQRDASAQLYIDAFGRLGREPDEAELRRFLSDVLAPDRLSLTPPELLTRSARLAGKPDAAAAAARPNSSSQQRKSGPEDMFGEPAAGAQRKRPFEERNRCHDEKRARSELGDPSPNPN